MPGREGSGSSVSYMVSKASEGCPITAFPFTVSCILTTGSVIGAGTVVSWGGSGSGAFNGIYIRDNAGTFTVDGYINFSADTLAVGPEASWDSIPMRVTYVCHSSTSRYLYVDSVSSSEFTASRTLAGSQDRWGIGVGVDSSPSSPLPASHLVADACIWDIAISTASKDLLHASPGTDDAFIPAGMVQQENVVAYAPINYGDDVGTDADVEFDVVGGRHLYPIGTGMNPGSVQNDIGSLSRFTKGAKIFIPGGAGAGPAPQIDNTFFHGSCF